MSGAHRTRRVTGRTLAWRKFRKHKLALAALAFLTLSYTVCIFAGFFAPYPPAESSERVYMRPQPIQFFDGDGRLQRPFVYGTKQAVNQDFQLVYERDESARHPIRFFVKRPRAQFGIGAQRLRTKLFGVDGEGAHINLLGTDYRGRDMLSRIIYGGRITLSVGVFGVALSTLLGVIIGSISGYYGGRTDMLIQRLIEMLSSIPTLPLLLALAAILPLDWPSTWRYAGIVGVLGLVGWTGLARQIRGMVLSIRERDYIRASVAGGADSRFIMAKHVVPNVMSHLIVVSTIALPGMILAESALSFLGLGIRPPQTSWGLLINEAQNLNAILLSTWIMLPGLAIILNVAAFNFLGDGLRDAADPYN
ncbi:MAG: ABC transporter permease [Spirochaetaceae bacterium]|nr:ABC transporter permease [Spirochaetaceae bacterium]